MISVNDLARLGSIQKPDRNKYDVIQEFYSLSVDLDENTILYKSRSGGNATDSPFAIFKHFQENEEFSHLTHVWVLKKSQQRKVLNFFEKRGLTHNIVFVAPGSSDYLLYLKKSKFIIINTVIESFFVKQPGQFLVNTWHGTPLKKMGYHVSAHPDKVQNSLRSLLLSDLITFPNKYTQSVFESAYCLESVYSGVMTCSGAPRDDLTVNEDSCEFIKKHFAEYLDFDPLLPTVLYAPTWKGSSIRRPLIDIDQLVTESRLLKEKLAGRYNVIVKVHPYVYGAVKRRQDIASMLVDDIVDANEVLSAVDVLITDYSSIFFDFLLSKKPIIFYSWDSDLYDLQRGLYIDESELPGPTYHRMLDILEEFDLIVEKHSSCSGNYAKMYKEMSTELLPSCTQNVINIMVEGGKQPPFECDESNECSAKKKILVSIGDWRDQSKLDSAKNFIFQMQSSTDISLIVDFSLMERNAWKECQNYGVRYLSIYSQPAVKTDNEIKAIQLAKSGVEVDGADFLWKREAARVLCDIHFDMVFNFDPGNIYIRNIILNSQYSYYVEVGHAERGDIIPSNSNELPHENLNSDKSHDAGLHKKMVQQLTHLEFCDTEIYVYNALMGDVGNYLPIKDCVVHGVAQYYNESDVYHKIIVDGVYRGWVLSNEYKSSPLHVVLYRQEVSLQARVNSRRRFYSEPYGTSINSRPVGYLKYYRDYNLHLVEKVVTTEGAWYLVKLNDHYIGWAMEVGLKILDNNEDNDQSFDFLHVIDIKNIHKKAVTNDTAVLWSEPPKTPLSRKKCMLDKNTLVTVDKVLALENNTKWAVVSIDGKHLGCLGYNDIDFISEV